MNILDLIDESGLVAKKKAGTHGGEFSSPCPFCKDGNDRFLIWPARQNKNGEFRGGRFFCRICRLYGDAITFLRKLHGLSFSDACEKLRIEPNRNGVTRVTHPRPPVRKLQTAEDPPALWQEKASVFIEWSHKKLLANSNSLSLLEKRGFTIESIQRFKIGYNAGERQRDFRRVRTDWGLSAETKEDGSLKPLWLPIGITIPTFSTAGTVLKIKIRRTSWKEGDQWPKYVEVCGSRQAPSVYGNISLPCLALESELDSLLIQQEAGDLVFCVALGGSTKPIDTHTEILLRSAKQVLFLPDFDKAGAVAWSRWKKMFPQIKRILTPSEKSAGDYFLAGGNLREWLKESIKKQLINEDL